MGNDGLKSYFSKALGKIRVTEEISGHSAQSQVGLVPGFCLHDYIHPVTGISLHNETMDSICSRSIRRVLYQNLSVWPITIGPISGFRSCAKRVSSSRLPTRDLKMSSQVNSLFWLYTKEFVWRPQASGRDCRLSG